MLGTKLGKVGRLGERKFSELCAKQDATCNESLEDEHGWDFVVETDIGNKSRLPADLRRGVTRSLVQVKSTRGDKKTVKLKLTNALKSVQNDLPCFLVLMKFDGSELSGVFVLHFWGAEIERVLRRAREAHHDGKLDLHKMEIQFSLGKQEVVQSRLIETLDSYVSKLGTNYAQEKKALRDNIGYSDERAVGNFTFADGVTARDIVDGQLDDETKLPLSSYDLKDVRFNIATSIVEESRSGAKLSITPSPLSGSLQIVKGTLSLDLDAEIFVPGLVPHEHEDFKVRIKTALVDITVSPHSSATLSAKFAPNLKTVWDHYVAAEVESCEDNGSVQFKIDCEAGILYHGVFCPNHQVDKRNERIVKGGRLATLVLGRQYLVDLSPDHTNVWHQISWLAKLEPVFGNMPKKLSFDFDDPSEFSCDSILVFMVFELGDYHHYAFFAFSILEETVENNRVEIDFDAPEILSAKQYKTDYESMRKLAQVGFDELINERKKPCIVVGTGDLMDWFSDDQDRSNVTLHNP